MNSFVKSIDKLPLWLKIVLCLPVLNIVYAIYRIFKGASQKNVLMTVAGIVWIFLGTSILWIVDLICTLASGSPKLFA